MGPVWWYRWCRRSKYSRKDALHIARNWRKIEKVEMVEADSGRVVERVKP